MSESLFNKLNHMNVNDHVEKKNGLSYLSWSWVHQELKKIDPDYTFRIHDFNHPEINNDNYFVPYLATPEGYSVTVSVTVKGKTETETLPVLDFKNKTVPYKQADLFQINKTYKRCFVKAAALHGLGLYIYNGDMMPETPFEPATSSQLEEIDKLVKELAPLYKLTETKLKTSLNVANTKNISTDDAQEAIERLKDGKSKLQKDGKNNE